MKKEEQILRIKELINESTLYGKLIDEEILNEGSTTKSVVKTASDLITTFLKFSDDVVDTPKVKAIIKAVQAELDTLNNSVTKETIDGLLDWSNEKNVYDKIGDILKTQLNVRQGVGFGGSKYLTKEIEDQIDATVKTLKGLKLDLFKVSFEKLPPSTQDILNTIPNIKKQYIAMRPAKYVLSEKFYSLMMKAGKTILKPLKIWENLPEAWKVWKTILEKNDAGKREIFKKLFQGQYELIGGKMAPIVSWWLIAIGKDIARATLMCDEYDKALLPNPNVEKAKSKVKSNVKKVANVKNTDDVKNTDGVNEQADGEQKSLAAGQRDWFFDGALFFLHVLSPKAILDPMTAITKALEYIGIDTFKGSGLIGEDAWSCPSRDEHKKIVDAATEVLEEAGVDAKVINEKIQEGTDSVIKYLDESVKEAAKVANIELESEQLSREEVIKALNTINKQ
jgi:hypothetical protein